MHFSILSNLRAPGPKKLLRQFSIAPRLLLLVSMVLNNAINSTGGLFGSGSSVSFKKSS